MVLFDLTPARVAVLAVSLTTIWGIVLWRSIRRKNGGKHKKD